MVVLHRRMALQAAASTACSLKPIPRRMSSQNSFAVGLLPAFFRPASFRALSPSASSSSNSSSSSSSGSGLSSLSPHLPSTASRVESPKPAACAADELHYVDVPGAKCRIASWRYLPCPKAPTRNHPLVLLSGVGTNAIGFDLSPGVRSNSAFNLKPNPLYSSSRPPFRSLFIPNSRTFSSEAPPPPPTQDSDSSTTASTPDDASMDTDDAKLAAPVEDDSKTDVANGSSLAVEVVKPVGLIKDVENAEFKKLINKFLHNRNEEALPEIMEAILRRRLSGKHEDTDDELVELLRMRPLEHVDDEDFEEDFEELHETDEEIENLYNTKPYIEKKMMDNMYFNMDDKKWDDMIRDATEQGVLKDTSECEEILEDMLSWDKLLPDEIKQKIEAKFNELEGMCESGEMEPEKAYELFKEFEDNMVEECAKMMESEQHDKIEVADAEKKVQIDDPPGEGPVLRWQTRVVFAPGGDAWHPKNRKVKLSVTVKELGLSRHAAHRLRELVGKRYNSGKDELTITSERFEHREENRKDCLRTLYALIEEAMRADKLAVETRNAFVKSRLRANEPFMNRLRAKVAERQGCSLTG